MADYCHFFFFLRSFESVCKSILLTYLILLADKHWTECALLNCSLAVFETLQEQTEDLYLK